MIQIRRSVFETNSSSSHAIIVKKSGKIVPREDALQAVHYEGRKRADEPFTIDMWESELEFGRSPFEVLFGWEDKLRYAIASYAYEDGAYDRILGEVKQYLPEIADIQLPKDYNGETTYGYVDHQSSGLLQGFLKKNNVSIRDFIFNDRYIVVIDGDEYQTFERAIECGIIDMDNIEHVYGAWMDE